MAILLVMLAGCGLPLPDGVRSAGDVRAAQPEAAPLQFLPAGPRKGATATELVSGFLAAQSSPDNDYAIAKQFLLPGAKWDISARTTLYRAGSNRAQLRTAGGNRVLVSYQPAGYIETDGSFSLPPADAERSTDPAYTFVREPASGELRLASVPAGVRLADIDRAGSYVARNVYFFARSDGGAGRSDRLVADRVFQRKPADPERALVGALLAGPSTGLAPPSESAQPRGAVESMVPRGTVLRGLRVDEGVVTVDLSGEVEALTQQDRRRLSAQFVWTLLPTFRGVRLLVQGRTLDVVGVDAVQDRDDWADYDPESLGNDVPLLYVADRRLRRLDGSLTSSEVTRNGRLDVDRGALAPDSRQLAVLTDQPGTATDVVHTGPLTGPFAPVFSRPRLGSLSWGSGDRGLYLLQQGSAPIIWLLPDLRRVPGGTARAVTYPPSTELGQLSALAVSRDGARIALVFGERLERRLYVARIEPTPNGPAVRRIVPVAPGLSNVADVAWESGTSLVVLASNDDRLSDDGQPKVLLFRVAVDGSSSDAPLNSTNLPNSGADAVAAAPGEPLVVGVRTANGKRELHEDTGAQFVQKPQNGSAPFYPG